MPAITVENPLVLPRLPPIGTEETARPILRVVTAHHQTEGAGFEIWRPFPGELSMEEADPFLLLDQGGPKNYGPNETVGAPWHPHRGFETVTYVMDGEISHHDTNGGGGVIREGDTQWMTAGSGILHDELPTEQMFHGGGNMHIVQLWVNLPASMKFTPPRYQSVTGDNLRLITTPDGASLLRIIAGNVGPFEGPGATHTPITYAHATISPGAQAKIPWNPGFSAFAYVLTGSGYAGTESRPLTEHQLVVFGPGDHIVLRASDVPDNGANALDVLLLGGIPIGEPIVHYGPFVMNTRDEIVQTLDDYRQGRLGVIPADQLAPRRFS
ncbi:MAG TPA: pirin family protein [Candidatus Baltobacteraceae bacterium]|nr:pirin family protein [Candidatus Baltobacteraceae bacterium]